MFGNPEVTPGGRALKFYASVRIDMRRISSIKEGEQTVGSRTRAKVVKNKIAPPFRVAEFDILYNEGISREGDLIDLGVQYNVLQKSGSWYAFGKSKLGQGRERVRELLRQNPDLANEIERKILLAAGVEVPAGTAASS
jgi:recombination protein RecA